MATYLELLTAAESDALRKKVRVACMVAGETIRTESTATVNHAARLLWARAVFDNPVAMADKMLWAVLAANKAVSLTAITGATDAQIQTNVDAAVDVFTV